MDLASIKKRYIDMAAPAKAALWFTMCNFLLKGISFITVPMFTRLLPSEEYGKLSVFTSYEQVILILATWEIQLGAYQKGIFKYKEDIGLLTSSTQVLTNLLTVALYMLLVLFYGFVTDFTGMNGQILTMLFIYLLVHPAYSCWLTRKRTAYEYRPAVAVTLLYSLVNVFVPLAAILILGRTADNKFGATLIGSSIICFVFYVQHADYRQLWIKRQKVREYWLFMIAFEGPVVLHSLSYMVLNQADRIMIGKMVGNSEAAFYSVAYSLAVVISILQTSLNQSLLPWRYQMLEQKNYKKIRDVTHGLLFGFSVVIMMYILVAPELVKLLFDDRYYEAIWCIPPVSASIFFVFLYTIFVNIESYFEKTKYIMYVSVTCGVINIVLNYICIGIFGYIACGYTTLASYVLFSLGHYYFMKKILRENDVEENIVDPQMILFIGIAVIGLTIVFALLYDRVLIRYSVLAALAAAAFIMRNRIIALFKTMRQKT